MDNYVKKPAADDGTLLFKQVVTIDPGRNTGYAVWAPGGKLVKSGTLKSRLKSSIERPIDYITEMTDGLAECGVFAGTDIMLIEASAYWGAGKGQVAADSGALVNLSMLIGAYILIATDKLLDVHMVRPIDWKGNLPDTAVAYRVKTIMGEQFPLGADAHCIDALGIGIWYQGAFDKAEVFIRGGKV